MNTTDEYEWTCVENCMIGAIHLDQDGRRKYVMEGRLYVCTNCGRNLGGHARQRHTHDITETCPGFEHPNFEPVAIPLEVTPRHGCPPGCMLGAMVNYPRKRYLVRPEEVCARPGCGRSMNAHARAHPHHAYVIGTCPGFIVSEAFEG